ncbi:cell surface hyaluronidase-like [Ylistrum balloti]|uniref:cell surface hyaluronidase-like n=1 Tax=Ylistrum balloti TaxID=509963 RepID=UPI00290595B2|nr:cell surface hyaluronidase-like [Ylistrum balloti]
MAAFGRLVLVSVFVSISNAACPDKEPGLKNWSDPATWPNGIPGNGADVIINDKIALDASPGVDLGSVMIVTGGQLVFLPNRDLILRTKFIGIKGGRMDIGSEDCLYEGKATIQLLGTSQDIYSVPGFGRKFLGVDVNGTLEIHGQKKLPWTKLTSPVPKLTDDAYASRDVVEKHTTTRGFMVNSYDPQTGFRDRPRGEFMIGMSHQKGIERETGRLIDYVNDIPSGNVIMLAVRKFIVDKENIFDRSQFYDAVEILGYGKVTGTSKIRDLRFYDSFAMIVVKGDTSKTVEGFDPYRAGGIHQTSTATLLSDDMRLKFYVESYTRSVGFGHSNAVFEVTYADRSIPTLDVSDNVASWQAGDKIFITSTDYDWRQVEVGTVFPCDNCNNNQIKVDLTAKFSHYGAITKNVDMRAEVGLLTRNIVIEGDMTNGDDQLGGHIKVLNGFRNFHIEGAELRRMGQSLELGNYPIHWHMCEDVDDIEIYPKPTYARENSIHESYARCVTVHATHGAMVADNICFKSIGHGYFLEDGGEKRTTFRGNLGVGQTKGNLVPTDVRPTTFWITNPQTIMENNVAAGGDGFGIWYIFPVEPIGPSKGRGYMLPEEASHTAITWFYNNVVHSNSLVGLKIDDSMDENGTRVTNNRYEPWNDPTDESSGSKQVEIVKLTAYKNRYFNAYMRGFIELVDSSLADSVHGLQIVRWRTGGQKVTNTVIIGDSENLGEPDSAGASRSLPNANPMAGPLPRKGLIFGIGPMIVKNVWFDGFADTANAESGALGFQPINGMYISTDTVLEGIGFGFDDLSEGNRVYQGPIPVDYRDGSRVERLFDPTGSITSVPGATIIRSNPFQMTPKCVERTNWRMAVCKENFAMLFVKLETKDSATMMRTDDIKTNRQTSDDMGQAVFNVVTSGAYGYLLKFNKILPKGTFSLRGTGMAPGHSFMIGVCVPKDLVFMGMVRKPAPGRMSEVDSVAGVTSGDGSKYYIDRDVGVLFVKFSYDSGNSLTTVMFFVKLQTSNRMDVDCEAAYSAKYGATQTVVGQSQLQLPAELVHSSRTPPQNAGAGSTRA